MPSMLEQMMINSLEGIGTLFRRRTKRDPNLLPNETTIIGRAKHLYQPKCVEDIYLSNYERLKHIFILGSTGSGKTKLIEHLIRQDILNGRGWCLIDPHGDLSENILKFVGS